VIGRAGVAAVAAAFALPPGARRRVMGALGTVGEG
jgi:hypothetical protein